MFIEVLFTLAKTRKQPKRPSVDDWVKKMWDMYTVEYSSVIIKDEILPVVTTCMDPESNHAKGNKSDGKGQAPWDFTHMWHVKQKATDEQTQQTSKVLDTTEWW